MNKEEILRRSRQENKKNDEREISIKFDAKKYGMYVGFLVLVGILFYHTFVLNNPSFQVEVFMIISSTIVVEEFFLYKNLQKKKYMIFGIIGLMIFVLETVIFLLVK